MKTSVVSNPQKATKQSKINSTISNPFVQFCRPSTMLVVNANIMCSCFAFGCNLYANGISFKFNF